MGLTADDYLSQLQALLPPGAAWPREGDATLTNLLLGLAEELARVDGRAEALLAEIDPRTTNELFADWERVLGLPDPCVTEPQTAVQRREAIVAKLTMTGGQTPAYLVAAARAIGYPISITEFDSFHAGSAAGDPLFDEDWRHAFQVNTGEETVRTFKAGAGQAGEPLRIWGNVALECLIERLKPAHAVVLFAYSLIGEALAQAGNLHQIIHVDYPAAI